MHVHGLWVQPLNSDILGTCRTFSPIAADWTVASRNSLHHTVECAVRCLLRKFYSKCPFFLETDAYMSSIVNTTVLLYLDINSLLHIISNLKK